MPENYCNRLERRRNPRSDFEVSIYEDEKAKIVNWVLMKDNIETGGDLFGLWIDKHKAVVQFVIGPGKDCRRTNVSFYQDINYLKEAGTHLTKNHGLCNIGQWHSHHRINLHRPSAGDENTVWENMPGLGLNRYIVIIATIGGQTKPKVSLNCFLFETNHEGRHYPVLKGKFKVLEGKSPFRFNCQLTETVTKGEEEEGGNKSRLKRKANNNDSFVATMFIVPKKLLCVKVAGKSQQINNNEVVLRFGAR